MNFSPGTFTNLRIIAENTAVSLNLTFENMIEYNMSEFSRFDASLPGLQLLHRHPGGR